MLAFDKSSLAGPEGAEMLDCFNSSLFAFIPKMSHDAPGQPRDATPYIFRPSPSRMHAIS